MGISLTINDDINRVINPYFLNNYNNNNINIYIIYK